MKSRLDVMSVKTNEAPITGCTVNALYRIGTTGTKTMVPLKGTAAQSVKTKFITGGPVIHDGKSVGKIASFALGAEAVMIEVSLSKVGAGYAPIRRNLYLSVSIEAEEGLIDMRVGKGSLTLVRGPLRLLTGAEAQEAFGSHYKTTLAFNPAVDGAALGVTLRGNMLNAPMRTTRTLDEFGAEQEITVRRRRRMVEI